MRLTNVKQHDPNLDYAYTFGMGSPHPNMQIYRGGSKSLIPLTVSPNMIIRIASLNGIAIAIAWYCLQNL
jgi:hypothetical protein